MERGQREGGRGASAPALPVLAWSQQAGYGFSLGRNRLAGHKGYKTEAVTCRLRGTGTGGQRKTDRFDKRTLNLEEARQLEAPKWDGHSEHTEAEPEVVGESRRTPQRQNAGSRRGHGGSSGNGLPESRHRSPAVGQTGSLGIGAPESLIWVVPTPRLEKPPEPRRGRTSKGCTCRVSSCRRAGAPGSLHKDAAFTGCFSPALGAGPWEREAPKHSPPCIHPWGRGSRSTVSWTRGSAEVNTVTCITESDLAFEDVIYLSDSERVRAGGGAEGGAGSPPGREPMWG